MPSEGGLPASLHMAVHDSLASAEARWREAWPRLAGTAFQSYDWVAAWWQELGRHEGWKPCIGELRAGSADGPTVLLLPLGFRREGLLRVMGFLGAEMADYQAPLIDPDFARGLTPAHASRLWNGLIATLPAVDVVRLRRMPLDLGGLCNPFATMAETHPAEQAHAARLPADFAQFAAGRATRIFADTRRCLRRLAEVGTVRVVHRVEDPAEFRSVMDALAAQKSRRWRDSGAFDAFAVPAFRACMERMARPGGMRDVDSVLSALLVDGQPIATHWGMRAGGRYYWLMPTYDEAWSRFSPGRVLMEAVIRRCIEDGLEVFDMTAGDEAYKFDWADEHIPLHALLQPWTTLGRNAVRLQRLREFARRQPLLRRAVQRLRGPRGG